MRQLWDIHATQPYIPKPGYEESYKDVWREERIQEWKAASTQERWQVIMQQLPKHKVAYIDEIVRGCQYKFTVNKSTTEHIFSIRQI